LSFQDACHSRLGRKSRIKNKYSGSLGPAKGRANKPGDDILKAEIKSSAFCVILGKFGLFVLDKTLKMCYSKETVFKLEANKNNLKQGSRSDEKCEKA
jgi:hypothetical protein